MITDALLQLSGGFSSGVATGQTVTGTNTTVLSTNTVDLGSARDIGKGEEIFVDIETITAASGGTSVQFQFVEADDAALSTNLTVLGQSDAIPVATLVAGARHLLRIPRTEPYAARRYVGLRYALVGAVAAGAYWAAIVKDPSDKQVNYANGFSVL